MSSELRNIFSLKFLLAGVISVLLGLGGIGYYYGQKAPPPVEQIPAEALAEEPAAIDPDATPTPLPSPDGEAPRTIITRETIRRWVPEAVPQEIPPPEIRISSPSFVRPDSKKRIGPPLISPAAVELEAKISPVNRKIQKVEFFRADTDANAHGIYNTPRDVQINEPWLIKVGEAAGKPYKLRETFREGSYSFYAIVTDEYGMRQISQPGTVIVNDHAFGKNEEDYGWRIPGGSGKSLFWSVPQDHIQPGRMTKPEKCLDLQLLNSKDVTEGEFAEFKIESGQDSGVPVPEGLKFKWQVTDGRIVNGQFGNSILVDTTGLGGMVVLAAVEIEDGTGCRVELDAKAYVDQKIDGLKETGYKNCRDVAEELSFFSVLDLHPEPNQMAINICPANTADPQNDAEGLVMKLSPAFSGVYANTPRFNLYANGGFIRRKEGALVWDLSSEQLIPGKYTIVMEGDDGCGVKTTYPRTVHITNYCTPCSLGHSSIDVTATLDGELSFGLIARSDGATGSASALRYNWSPPWGTVVEGQGTGFVKIQETRKPSRKKSPRGFFEIAVAVSGLKALGGAISFQPSSDLDKNDFYYDWLVFNRNGKILEARKTKTITLDTAKLGDADDATLIIKVNDYLFFDVVSPEWALAGPVGENTELYNWSVSKGKIAQGQGTGRIAVDTEGLAYGEEIIATARIVGVKDYCYKEISVKGQVGIFTPLTAAKAAYPKWMVEGSKARRKNPDGTFSETTVEKESAIPGNSTGDSGQGDTKTASASEKEYIKAEWPVTVKIQQSFSVIVTYNRVTQSMEVTDTAGGTVSEIELKNKVRSFKDRLKKLHPGASDDDLEVLAQVKLQSAGLHQAGDKACSPCESEFYSLADTQQKWMFNVMAQKGGEHTFNLTMFIKGRVRDTDKETQVEKVWEKDNLKVTADGAAPTRNQIFYSSGALCFFGLVFAVRGIKFGNIKVLIAGGNIAGRDMAGGDIVGGDKVGGDKVGGDKTTSTGDPPDASAGET